MATGDLAEIGKYRIVGQIGEGAMGVVYRGLDPVLNRSVAIKVMSDAVARDHDLRARFLREAQSAGSLQHPNLVTVYDFGEVDGHPFIAMELVEGADLDELLRRSTPLSLVEKIDILIDVLNGLSYAHRRGIVHRDIKPANIRIDQEGRARIMDFGIAHLNSSSGTRMTRTGMMVGTPAYMSPEQITGDAITPSSDIFSLGAVMYELLAGATAFQADTLQSIMYQIVTVPAPALTISPPPTGPNASEIATSLDTIAARALGKEPRERFATALEMSTALSDVRSRVVQGTRGPGPASLRASVAKAMAEVAEPPKVRSRRPVLVGIGAAVAAVVVVAIVLASRRHESSAVTTAVIPTAPSTPTASVGTSSPASPAPAANEPTPLPPNAKPIVATNGPTASGTPSSRELALIRDLQATALDARRRAVDAGASAAALDSGDAHNRIAGTLITEGKASEAGEHLRQATAAWTSSERAARLAAATPATGPRTTDLSRPQNVPPVIAVPAATVAQQSIAASPPPSAVQPPPTTPATQTTASNPAADVAAAIAAYARSLESRDVPTVRHAYPGLTASQAKGWEQFFSTLRSLRVSLVVNGLDVNGSSADAKVVGQYDYVTDAGKAAQQPVSFQASFRRENGVWQLTAVH